MTPVLASLPPERQSPSEASLPVRVPLRRWGAARPFAHRTPRRLLGASVVAHLLLLVLAVVFLRIGRESSRAPIGTASPGQEEQLTYLDIGAAGAGVSTLPAAAADGEAGETADTAGARIAAPPVAARAPGTPAPALPGGGRGVAGTPSAPVGGAPAGVTAAPGGLSPGGAGAPGERAATGASGVFRPGYRDPRLYVPPQAPPPPPTPTEHERYMAQLEARLGTANDSMIAEQQRARNALDWTIKDKNGKRWGVGPDGKVVLGGVEIPVPIRLPPGDRAKEEEATRRERERQAIINDEATRERREVMQERIRATRERKDAERRKQREGGG